MDADSVRTRLEKTLEELAAFGPKIAGTPSGTQAGDYVSDRLSSAGISDVKFESFSFQSYVLGSSSLAVTLDGAATTMAHQVFHYSGAGHVDADVVDVGLGHEEDYAGKDVTGKVVLVVRDPSFHRQAQLALVAAHGGAAMLYISQSPDNLIQIGTVADPEDGIGTVPAVTVGKDDGDAILAGIAAGKTAHAVIDVQASLAGASGRNVVARIPGSDPSGAYVVIGAHYDTWQVGSTDNGSGTAVLLELADQLARDTDHRLGITFIGYDGEELGLFGGYDYLRKHVVVGNEPMLAFINLEMPGAGPPGTGLRAVASTSHSPLNDAMTAVNLKEVYTLPVGMEVVPAMFGGLIPTDIQGMYWWGLHGLTTYCETSYYHTDADTPDKIDTPFLAKATLRLADLVREMDGAPIASFGELDPKLWALDVTTADATNGDLEVSVTARDAAGTTKAAAAVRVWVDVDDFTRVADVNGTTDAAGKVTLTIPASALSAGTGGRWLHATGGETYPLAERILPLP